MAIKTTLEQIEEVQAAISAVTTSQSYTSGAGKSLTRADLDALTRREQYLLDRYYRESGERRPAISVGTLRRD